MWGRYAWLAHKSSKARPLKVLGLVAGLGSPSLKIEHEISTSQNIHAEDMPWEQNTRIGIGSGQFLPDICRPHSNTIKSKETMSFYLVKVGLKSWQCLDIEALLVKCGQGAMTPGNVRTTWRPLSSSFVLHGTCAGIPLSCTRLYIRRSLSPDSWYWRRYLPGGVASQCPTIQRWSYRKASSLLTLFTHCRFCNYICISL
jgi:hypothetical protein